MILAFTSSAFLNWVNKNISSTKDAAFNPYLTFLFMAL
jgi:chitin synthase